LTANLHRKCKKLKTIKQLPEHDHLRIRKRKQHLRIRKRKQSLRVRKRKSKRRKNQRRI